MDLNRFRNHKLYVQFTERWVAFVNPQKALSSLQHGLDGNSKI